MIRLMSVPVVQYTGGTYHHVVWVRHHLQDVLWTASEERGDKRYEAKVSLCACVDIITAKCKQNVVTGTPTTKIVVAGDVSAHGRVFRNVPT